ncbi:TonB-dependent receptor domain-containing protein [Zobellella sp. DQSA1]|uniref:TonB-dependent receptor domain-containing protein n=1 Tax=Zobellella sp. DQSA1 TaxID=3342386 RepID=UPI0035C2684C
MPFPLPSRLACAVSAALMTSSLPSLAQQAQVFDTIVVSASGFEQDVKDAPASISVITAEELKAKSFRDLTDALRSVPGVTITGGGASQDISIRGMAAQYTLILVDGKRQGSRQTRPNSDGPGIEQGWIPPLDMIERIEVVRGPMSSLYGSDAMGGVINIITKKVGDSWTGSVRLENSFRDRGYAGDSQQASAAVSGPLVEGLLGVQLSGKVSRRDEDDRVGYYPKQEMNGASLRFDLTPTEHQDIRLDLNRSKQERTSTPGKSRDTGGSVSESEYERTQYSLSHEGRWTFGTSQLSYTHEKAENKTRDMEIKNQVVDTSLLLPVGDHLITLGGQYMEEALDDSGNKYQPEVSSLERWRGALFLEDEWQLTDSFALTGGVRFNRDQNYGNEVTPRLYGVWRLHDNWTLKGGVSTGFSAPGLREVATDWGQVTGGGRRDGVILGNPDLKPEKTVNEEIALLYEDETGFSAGLTLFNTDFKDKVMIYTQCDDATNSGGCTSPSGSSHDFIQTRDNVDSARIQGLEVNLGIPLGESLSLSGQYSFTDSEQRSGANKGDPLNKIPRHQASATLDWQATDQLTLWTTASYMGSETELNRSGAAGQKYDAYKTLDIGGNYRASDATSLLFGIYNLTDTDINSDQHGRVLDGRTYWVGLDVRF